MKNLNEAKRAYANHKLTDFLKGCTLEELNSIYDELFLDDIIGYRINILDALDNEYEYRNSKNISSKIK